MPFRTLLPGPLSPLVRLEDAGMAEQMAEYATYAALRCYREFAAYERAQAAERWEPRPRWTKAAFGIGILGMGTLGRGVTRALLDFGFPVAAWSRTRKDVRGVTSFTADHLESFLASSRMLICMLPLTQATRGLLNRKTLAQLPQGAYIVNVARGALLVEDDLLAWIDNGHLAGAMLDVFERAVTPRPRFLASSEDHDDTTCLRRHQHCAVRCANHRKNRSSRGRTGDQRCRRCCPGILRPGTGDGSTTCAPELCRRSLM
jgi:glyoxylate/hydroxypyruvate reductase A